MAAMLKATLACLSLLALGDESFNSTGASDTAAAVVFSTTMGLEAASEEFLVAAPAEAGSAMAAPADVAPATAARADVAPAAPTVNGSASFESTLHAVNVEVAEANEAAVEAAIEIADAEVEEEAVELARSSNKTGGASSSESQETDEATDEGDTSAKVPEAAPKLDCVNVGMDVKDARGKGCLAYSEKDCGKHDNGDFTASALCCTCGGGILHYASSANTTTPSAAGLGSLSIAPVVFPLVNGPTTTKPPGGDHGCFEDGITWEPLDMPNSSGYTKEVDAFACQQRCHATPGCVHFSFWNLQGHCHLQDAYAIRQWGRIGFVSGPFKCWSGLDHNLFVRAGRKTYLPGILKCMEPGVLYSPSMGKPAYFRSTGVAEAVKQCQEHCNITSGCKHFTLSVPTRMCRLAGAQADKLKESNTVSGPPECFAEVSVGVEKRQAVPLIGPDAIPREAPKEMVVEAACWQVAAFTTHQKRSEWLNELEVTCEGLKSVGLKDRCFLTGALAILSADPRAEHMIKGACRTQAGNISDAPLLELTGIIFGTHKNGTSKWWLNESLSKKTDMLYKGGITRAGKVEGSLGKQEAEDAYELIGNLLCRDLADTEVEVAMRYKTKQLIHSCQKAGWEADSSHAQIHAEDKCLEVGFKNLSGVAAEARDCRARTCTDFLQNATVGMRLLRVREAVTDFKDSDGGAGAQLCVTGAGFDHFHSFVGRLDMAFMAAIGNAALRAAELLDERKIKRIAREMKFLVPQDGRHAAESPRSAALLAGLGGAVITAVVAGLASVSWRCSHVPRIYSRVEAPQSQPLTPQPALQEDSQVSSSLLAE